MVHLFNQHRPATDEPTFFPRPNKSHIVVAGALSSILLSALPSCGASDSSAAGTALTVVGGIGQSLSSWGWSLLYYGALFSISAFILGLLLPMRWRQSSQAAQA
jgi:hypothetical protein